MQTILARKSIRKLLFWRSPKIAIAVIPIAFILLFFLFPSKRGKGETISRVDIDSSIEELKTSKNVRSRSLAVLNLGKFESDSSEILTALLFAFDDNHEIVRLRATVALIDKGTLAIPTLVEGLKHQKERVREQASFAIAIILEREKKILPGCIAKNPEITISSVLKLSRSFGETTCSLKSLSQSELNAAIANLKIALESSNFTDNALQQNAIESLQQSLVELKQEQRDRWRKIIPKWLLFGIGSGIVVFCLLVPFENFVKRKSLRSPSVVDWD